MVAAHLFKKREYPKPTDSPPTLRRRSALTPDSSSFSSNPASLLIRLRLPVRKLLGLSVQSERDRETRAGTLRVRCGEDSRQRGRSTTDLCAPLSPWPWGLFARGSLRLPNVSVSRRRVLIAFQRALCRAGVGSSGCAALSYLGLPKPTEAGRSLLKPAEPCYTAPPLDTS